MAAFSGWFGVVLPIEEADLEEEEREIDLGKSLYGLGATDRR